MYCNNRKRFYEYALYHQVSCKRLSALFVYFAQEKCCLDMFCQEISDSRAIERANSYIHLTQTEGDKLILENSGPSIK